MERRTKTFKVSVPITLERQEAGGKEVRYGTTAYGVFFYILPYTGDLKGVILDRHLLKPALPFEATIEEMGLIIEALYRAAEDYLRQNT